MYMPHTVTVYHEYETNNMETVQHITVLHGVFLDEATAARAADVGVESEDSAILYIPFDVDAKDGSTSVAQSYVGAKAYEQAADKSAIWTLDTNGNSFFVKGNVVCVGKSFEYINGHYDDVYRVTKVDAKDFGSAGMRHLEVGAR